MKAVIWHSEGPKLWDAPVGLYKTLFQGFMETAHAFGIEVIHLTTPGHDIWGDEGRLFDLNPQDVTLNREIAFTSFLGEEPDDIYWFTEPDCRIKQPLMLNTDLCLLYREGDKVPITPSFRLATKAALPVFEQVLNNMEGQAKDWHGDSAAWNILHRQMKEPKLGVINYQGVSVEFRPYKDYNSPSGKYVTHHKFVSKMQLVP